MIKGCQKKIIFLKNTGCDLFEEAYFIVKDGSIDKGESDIVLEATKIVNNIKSSESLPMRKSFWKQGYVLFILGAMLGFGISLLSYAVLS